MAERPSLDRLKGLDSIPILSEQLKEAKQLCTHPVRADMVARWVLNKLNTDDALESGTWALLLDCLRLLSPERIGTLLASHDILALIKATFSHPDAPKQLIDNIVATLRYLLDLSHGPNGAPVEAALKTTAASASSFLGSWLRCVHEVISSDGLEVSPSDVVALLSPGVEIWNLRRPDTEENRLFSQNCLVPAALLLSSPSLQVTDRGIKRKRSNEKKSHDQSGEAMVEALLARHICAAGRTAFWKDPRPESMIRELLKPLREGDRHVSALPALLDVALRCSSTSTLLQRTKDGPWVEEVFQEVLGCCVDDARQLIDLSVLTELLSTIRRHTRLSRDTYKALYDRYGDLERVRSSTNGDKPVAKDQVEAEDPTLPPIWAFIIELVQSDREIFDQAATAQILSAISQSSQHDRPNLFSLQLEIVVPIMKAFAKRRDLATFMDIWSRYTGLEDIANEFSDVVQEFLTKDAFLQQVQKYHDLIDDLTLDGADESKLSTVFVILEALLAGVETTALQEALVTQLEALLNILLELGAKDSRTSPSDKTPNDDLGERPEYRRQRQRIESRPWIRYASFWSLLNEVFGLWFPIWSTQGLDQDQIYRKGYTLLTGEALSSALDTANLYSAKSTRAAARAASMFVGRTCSAFMWQGCGYAQDCKQIASKIAQPLLSTSGTLCIEVVSTYPGLCDLVDPIVIKDGLVTCMKEVVGAKSGLPWGETRECWLVQAMESLALWIATSGHAKLTDSFTYALQEQLRMVEDGEEQDIIARKDMALTLLAVFPPSALTRDQREDIIFCVFEDQVSSHDSNNAMLTGSRLSLVVKMMEVPNATCILSTDADALWRLHQSVLSVESVESVHAIDASRTGMMWLPRGQELMDMRDGTSGDPFGLLKELAALTIRHLLATQDQQRSQAVLIGIADQIKTRMQSIQKSFDDRASSWSANVANDMIGFLESGAKTVLKAQLSYREPSVFDPYLTLLSEAAWAPFAANGSPAATPPGKQQLIVGLHALRTLPSDLIPSSAYGLTSSRRQMSIESSLRTLEGAFDDAAYQQSTAAVPLPVAFHLWVVISRYIIGCKYGTSGEHVSYALLCPDLLRFPVPPCERKDLLEAFSGFVHGLDESKQIEILYKLHGSPREIGSHTFELVEICLFELEDVSNDRSMQSVQACLRKLLGTLAGTQGDVVRQAAGKCIATVIKRKSFFANQHLVEETLGAILLAISKRKVSSMIYLQACTILATILLQYRARLRGRYQLAVKVFQVMITALFTGIHQYGSNNPTVTCAERLTRLLILLCEPPHLRRQNKTTSLVDESRKEQAYIGQYVRHILHHYCGQVLVKAPVEGLREALTPAVWSMIEAMEINEAAGIKSLSDAMNNSERAVLRGEYDEWRRFGKWRGG